MSDFQVSGSTKQPRTFSFLFQIGPDHGNDQHRLTAQYRGSPGFDTHNPCLTFLR